MQMKLLLSALVVDVPSFQVSGAAFNPMLVKPIKHSLLFIPFLPETTDDIYKLKIFLL